MNAFEEKMWERREGEMIGEKRGKKSEQLEIYFEERLIGRNL